MRSVKGFTLIELLVVLSIITLMLAVATPLFIRSRRSLKLNAAANNIAAALRTARSYAITKHGEHWVDFYIDLDSDNDWFYLAYQDPDDAQKRIIVEKKFRIPEKVDICDSSFLLVTINDSEDPDYEKEVHRARFKSTGAFNGTNGQEVCIKDAHNQGKRISVKSTTGAIEIEDKTPE